ncbi:MAG TPA: fused MFS/spermidine synthase [Terriglobales bacterium]|nr:fused MFS/spermidine synthase [Terriglobales bacterium]
MFWYFAFFLLSGFCGILYELVWLRLAMAQFGVTTALVSMVLSAFMGGIGLGSIAAGRLLRRYGETIRFPPLRLYAVTEFLIGLSALAVPYELSLGHHLLSSLARSVAFSSVTYSLISGICVALTFVPWCTCMGATIPVAMFAIRADARLESRRSFSFLYASNVLGAVLGTILPLAVIELRGFHFTLKFGMLMNCLIAAAAYGVTFIRKSSSSHMREEPSPSQVEPDRRILLVLFLTGLTSMGLEVVWIRMFTPFVGVMVYSFAMILGTYLVATFIGSSWHNSAARNDYTSPELPWAVLSILTVLPAWSCAPNKIYLPLRLFVGIVPFAAVVGYLTPKLVDLWSGGDADRAGDAYAINVLGCILGPLLAGFVLLPLLSERWILLIFAVPWLLIGPSKLLSRGSRARPWSRPPVTASFAVLTLLLALLPKTYERIFSIRVVRRDNTATVIAAGTDLNEHLIVNGVGITTLTPITKTMAHLPLALLDHQPQSALVICFGMGTTFRSVLSWRIHATAVDLVPSVPKLFWYFHSDAPELLRSPLSRVIIDDGRRYLERTSDSFDLITIDPPPPVSAAGSSLLYSTEFYALAKKRLGAHGILQQWLPEEDSDPLILSSVAQALQLSFQYIRVFRSLRGTGHHFLASNSPFPNRDAGDLARQLDADASRDFVEWGPEVTAQGQFARLLKNEMSLDSLIAEAPQAPVLRDDRPTNEYFLLRVIKGAPRKSPMPAERPLSAGKSLPHTSH